MRSSRHGRTPVRIAALAVAATVGTGMLTALPASAEVEDTASSIGWYRPSDGSFHLNDAVAADDASDRAFVYGPAGDGTLTAVSGDWDGDRASSVGWYRPSDGSWHLTNATTSGATTHYAFVYGPAGDASVTPVAGDWDADGKDSVGWYRPGDGSWHLTNKRDTPSSSDVALVSGPAGDATVQPVVGDWDGYVPPVVPPSNPAPPAVTGQQAAADLLASGRVTGADGVMAQIRGVASGQPYTDVRVCHLDPTLLGVLRTLVVERGYSLYVTSFNRYCTDTLTGSGQASYHWRDGGGHAIDLGRVNGVRSTGGTAQDIALIRDFASLVPGKAGVGQRQCRGPLSLPANVVTFNDTCNHVHLEYRGY